MKTDFTTWTSAEAMAVLTEIEACVQPTDSDEDDGTAICTDEDGCPAEVCLLAASIRAVISRKGERR